jgi:hypothetical protein
MENLTKANFSKMLLYHNFFLRITMRNFVQEKFNIFECFQEHVNFHALFKFNIFYGYLLSVGSSNSIFGKIKLIYFGTGVWFVYLANDDHLKKEQNHCVIYLYFVNFYSQLFL